MRIVFFGASTLGFACCKALINSGFNVVGIFTIPHEFQISYSKDRPVKNYLFADFYTLGEEYKIPVFEVNQNIKDHFENLESLKPDFLLAIGWYYMLPQSMLALARKGGAGIHASLLPKYRGNAPLVWAIINGEKETGVTFFYFANGVDIGDIIAQESFAIEKEDNIKYLLEKTEHASIRILKNYLPKIENGTAPRIEQNHLEATSFPKRSPEDGLIDWSWNSDRIYNFIRAQTKPYPGAYTYINGKKVIIWDASVQDMESLEETI